MPSSVSNRYSGRTDAQQTSLPPRIQDYPKVVVPKYWLPSAMFASAQAPKINHKANEQSYEHREVHFPQWTSTQQKTLFPVQIAVGPTRCQRPGTLRISSVLGTGRNGR